MCDIMDIEMNVEKFMQDDEQMSRMDGHWTDGNPEFPLLFKHIPMNSCSLWLIPYAFYNFVWGFVHMIFLFFCGIILGVQGCLS